MTDPAQIIRAHFPEWDTDPAQKAAVDAVLRILFAGESASKQLEVVETCLAFLLEDLPTSLFFDSPARQAEELAVHLEALALELRKGVKAVRALEPYYLRPTYNDSISPEQGADDGIRPEDRGTQTPPGDRFIEPPF